ncbi:phasin family protein [Roseovarius tibetensis]|uniref:phasin family protein n=1 Tax=Roseovarius tibetensis TaxID=2685897 RepID=UPI003D7FB155
MAKQNTKSASNDIQSLFDPQGFQDVFKTLTSANERMTSIFVETATKSTDIAADTAKEAFSNLREVTTVRDEPADYAKVYSDFVQKQMDLLMGTSKSLSEVTQKLGTEATEFASKTGEDLSGKVTAKASQATDKATSAEKKAA